MNLFNTRTLSQNQRFYRILILGIPFAIILGIVYGFITSLAGGWELHVLYILMGYGIGNFVAKYGRGAQNRFKTVALVLTLIVIIIGDVIYPALAYGYPLQLMVSFTLNQFLNGISGLLSLLFRASALYFAYNNAI